MRPRRATLRTGGFVSVSSGNAGGGLVTRPLTFAGDELVVNFATLVVATLRVEIQDFRGRSVEGYRLEDCEPLFGDQTERVVRWRADTDVNPLALHPIRLRFYMGKEIDL